MCRIPDEQAVIVNGQPTVLDRVQPGTPVTIVAGTPVRLPDGNAFEFRPPVGTVTRQGDPVTIDVTFGAPAPSALPR